MIQSYSSSGNISSNKISQAYMSLPPNKTIEGKVLSKEGKNLRIEDKSGTQMDLVLKKDIDIVKGQLLEISRRDIESIKIVGEDKIAQEQEEVKTDEQKLKDIGLKQNDENKDAVKNLKRFEIPLTKENVEKYIAVKNTIENLKTNLNLDAIAKLKSQGYDIENMSVWEVEAAVNDISKKSDSSSENEILKTFLAKDISYDEARKIAKEIYGAEMGKDVLDSIKSLKKMGIEISKTNIDNIHDIFSKLHNIKGIDNKTLVDAIKLDEDISIDLLYKLKNYIQNSAITSSGGSNVAYSSPSVRPISEVDLSNMENEIKRFIKEIGLNESDIDITKDLLRKNQGITKAAVENIKELREMLVELQKLMDKDTASYLIKQGIDIGSKDIKSLLEMIKEFQLELEQAKLQQFTQEELLKANKLIEAVKGISKDKIVSENVKLVNLISDKRNNESYNFLFSQAKELKVLSAADTIMLRTAAIFQNVESLSSVSIKSYNETISMLDIGRSAGVVPQSFSYTSSLTSIEFESSKISESVSSKQMTDGNETEASKHYEYLRINIRSVHIYAMVNEGIDPLKSDMRSMGAYVERYEYTSSKYQLSSMTNFDIAKLSSDIVKNPEISSIRSVMNTMDNLKPKSLVTQMIDKIMEEADKKQLNDISKIMRSVVRTLENPNSLTKEASKENTAMFYQYMKETEEIVKTLKKEDKDIFEKYLRQMSEQLRENSKSTKGESMLQIPFYMNQEGSQANVFVKNPKKKDKIDPDDMSILMDLNTKKLGNLGFYLKVEKKTVSVKISAGENVLSSIKSEMTSLQNLFQNIGYELKGMELSGDEDTAKIAFVEETAREMPSGLDVKV